MFAGMIYKLKIILRYGFVTFIIAVWIDNHGTVLQPMILGGLDFSKRHSFWGDLDFGGKSGGTSCLWGDLGQNTPFWGDLLS